METKYDRIYKKKKRTPYEKGYISGWEYSMMDELTKYPEETLEEISNEENLEIKKGLLDGYIESIKSEKLYHKTIRDELGDIHKKALKLKKIQKGNSKFTSQELKTERKIKRKTRKKRIKL